LAVEGSLILIAMLAVSFSNSHVFIIASVSTITFAKGLMYPSITALLARKLHPEDHDMAFIATTQAGRVADVMSAMIISVTIQNFGLTWPEAVKALLVIVFIIYGLALSSMPLSVIMADVRPAQAPPNTLSLYQKLTRYLSDKVCWYALMANLGTYAVWALYDYIGVLFSDKYGLQPGPAAKETVYISIGSIVGMSVAFVASWKLGTERGRTVHLLQTTLSVLALGLLSIDGLSIGVANSLLFLVGFGFVVAAYLPILLLGASASEEERAFRTAITDGLSTIIALGFTIVYGGLREHDQVNVVYIIATCAMLMSSVSFWLFYRNIGSTVTLSVLDPRAS